MDATALAVPFGTKTCDVPGYEDCWVRFATRGYPRKLRREWDDAASLEDGPRADAYWAIAMRYVLEWNLRDVDGQALALPPVVERTRPYFDNVEDAVFAWVLRAFNEFWPLELMAPRPNSWPPSPTMPTAAAALPAS